MGKGNHYNYHLQRAVNYYGIDNFEFNILEKCSEELLDEQEIYWIKHYNTTNKNFGYNLREGGLKGKLSYETKQKIRIAHLGKPGKLKERKMSEETKRKLSEKAKERLKNKTNHPFYGKHHSNETKQKLSLISKNMSEQQRKQISDRHKGKTISTEQKIKCSLALRGENNGRCKITEKQALEIIRMLENNIPTRIIAKELNVSSRIVEGIKYGKIWKHLLKKVV